MKQNSHNEVYYVIKHFSTSAEHTSDIPPPAPPPTVYYGNLNFILLDSSTIYVHTLHVSSLCGTRNNDTKPPRLGLVPDNLNKVNMDSLPHFLAAVINDTPATNRHFFASIASPTDTIRNRAFKTITDLFTSKKITRYLIRNWTEEERFVTEAKIKNKRYHPDSIDWKIGYEVKFKPPEE